MEKRWRCKVCGYIHRGDEVPEICPVCGVGSDKFELMEEDGESDSAVMQGNTAPGLIEEMMISFQPHAVMAHFPNALLPVLALFLLIYLVGDKALDHGIYLLLALVPVCVLVTFVTGIYSWRKHYNSARTRIFHRKLVLGGCLVLISAEMLLLRYNNPELLNPIGGSGWFFLVLSGAALFCVTMLGHYGGMLVFGRVEDSRKGFK